MATQDIDPLDVPERAPSRGAEARIAIERADVRWILDGPRGRRIVWALLQHGGMGLPSFTPGLTRDLDLAYAAGRRDAAEQLLELIRRHAADLYPKLVEEQHALARTTGTPDPTDRDHDDHGTLAEHAAR